MTSPKFVGAYCLKQRKLAKIWRAIARRRLMGMKQLEIEAEAWAWSATDRE